MLHFYKTIPRLFYGNNDKILDPESLLDIQIKSYKKFIDFKIENSTKIFTSCNGIDKSLKTIFPISSYTGHVVLNYTNCRFKHNNITPEECKIKEINYEAGIFISLNLVFFNKNNKGKQVAGKSYSGEIYIGAIPLMTDNGLFIINGNERVIISQLTRAPGVLFESHYFDNTELCFTAKIIPHKGAWVNIMFGKNGLIYFSINKSKKNLITVLFKAFSFTESQIVSFFFKKIRVKLKKNFINTDMDILYFAGIKIHSDILIKNTVIVPSGTIISKDIIQKLKLRGVHTLNYVDINDIFLINKIILHDVINIKTEKIIIKANKVITYKILSKLYNANIKYINIINQSTSSSHSCVLNTLAKDKTKTSMEALCKIHKAVRPFEPRTNESAESLFHDLFFNKEKYNLSKTGRMKLNQKVHDNNNNQEFLIDKNDIINVVKKLVAIKAGKYKTDDIDDLSNRRIKGVGELVESQFKNGLLSVKRLTMEKLSSLNTLKANSLQGIICINPAFNAIKKFFCSNELSQFMEQTNPLAEITHKRRVSLLGDGGVNRERAGMEIRDIHNTHYGKICPIETPEGLNIGLVSSLSLYAKIDEYGFIKSPYKKIINNKVSKHIEYLSTVDEYKYIISKSVKKTPGKFISKKLILCKVDGKFLKRHKNKVNYVDAEPNQAFSISAGLIPFLEHSDANRALMGSNMQRQSVPLLNTEQPIVSTGIECIAAKNSKITIHADRGGIVYYCDASQIIIKVNKKETTSSIDRLDIYDLKKYKKSNQNTCINYKPAVVINDIILKGDLLADGPSTNMGHLSLGQNLLVAFMSWKGYNFEDSIIVSENVIKKDKLISIHIEELSCVAIQNNDGKDEITRNIPDIDKSEIEKLDHDGIIYIGSDVIPGDILVGKVSPNPYAKTSPEEKLLKAVLGEKVSNTKNTSLYAKDEMQGTIIDVRIFLDNEIFLGSILSEPKKYNLQYFETTINDAWEIKKKELFQYIKYTITKEMLSNNMPLLNIVKKKKYKSEKNISVDDLLDIKFKNKRKRKKIKELVNTLIELKKKYKNLISEYIGQRKNNNILSPGVLKIVKIFVAMKKNIQPGDKISGRHGNKGVVSIIVPPEDMPYLKNGVSVDIILNPLGVPSRMNVGQILETHLGWASMGIVNKLKYMNKFKINKKAIIGYLNIVYNKYGFFPKKFVDFNMFDKDELISLYNNIASGIGIITPVFNSVSEIDIRKLFKLSDLNHNGQSFLYDGITGTKFDRKITVGYMYIIKLNHLADDKMHARSTGSYSLITQQPLGGKSRLGGQRFGEMEVWALEAYGAAYTLQEMLTIKSDDMFGRTDIYKNIISGDFRMEPSLPESFNVLIKEIRALGFSIELELK